MIKNPNCSEANLLVIQKRDQGFKLGIDENKSSLVTVRVGLSGSDSGSGSGRCSGIGSGGDSGTGSDSGSGSGSGSDSGSGSGFTAVKRVKFAKVKRNT